MTACQLSLDSHAARARTATPALPLRPYQAEALEAVDQAELRGISRQLVVLPTGGGKAVVAAHLIASRQRRAGSTGRGSGRALFLAHRDELIQQAADKLRQVAPSLEVGIVKAERDETGADVIIASVQTLARPSRLARLEPDFDLIITDEAHHATSPTWVGVLSGLGAMRDDGRGPLVLGITATPERSDRVGLGQVWQEIVYSRSILEMITDGYLVDARGLMVSTPADLARLRVSHGDLVDAELGAELVRSGALGSIAEAYATHARDRKGVAFVPTVETAYSLAEALRAEGIHAEGVDGTTPREQRRAILGRLHTGETQVVCNAMLLCLDAETEILTDQGWAGIDEMTESHQVANWDDGRIFFERPREIVRRPRAPGEDMVYLETPRRSIRVTGGHRMLYRVTPNDVWGKVAARDLVGWSAELPTCGDGAPLEVTPEQPSAVDERQRRTLISKTAYNLRAREGFEWDTSFKEARRRVERKLALRRKTPSELTLDECALIGFWLGDGSANHPRRSGIEYTLVQSTSYPAIVRWVDKTIAATGLHAIRRLMPGRRGVAPAVRWSFGRGTGGGSQEREGLFALEPYLDKNGSPLLWGFNHDQFVALLTGLWCADGDHGRSCVPPDRNAWVISSSNHRLLSLLQAIAVCRRWSARIAGNGRARNPHHAPMYRLALHRRRTHKMSNRLPGSVLRQEDGWREERVWCVKTTSRNIITRRRGTVTVMGNTEGWDEPSISCVLMARPTKSRPLYIQAVGRGLRIYPGKTDCLILDVAGATARLDLVTVADLAGLSKQEIQGRTIAEAAAERQEREAKERGQAEALKVATETAAASLFRSKLRWIEAGGTFVLSVDGGMIRLEPEGTGETWRVRRDLRNDRRVVAEGLSLEYAQGLGEDQVRQLGASTLAQADAPWRRAPAHRQAARLPGTQARGHPRRRHPWVGRRQDHRPDRTAAEQATERQQAPRSKMTTGPEEGISRFHQSTFVPAYLPEGLLFSDLSDRAKVIYAALGRFGDLGIDSTSEQLAEDLHCTADEIEEALAALEHGGWVLRAGDDVFLLSGTAGEHICGDGRTASECPTCVVLDRELMILKRRGADPWATPDTPPVTVVKHKQKIPASLRRAVFKRDAYRCRECGTHFDLTIDHIIPESLGGPTAFENLQTLCRSHNSSKGVKVLGTP